MFNTKTWKSSQMERNIIFQHQFNTFSGMICGIIPNIIHLETSYPNILSVGNPAMSFSHIFPARFLRLSHLPLPHLESLRQGRFWSSPKWGEMSLSIQDSVSPFMLDVCIICKYIYKYIYLFIYRYAIYIYMLYAMYMLYMYMLCR